MIIGLDSSQMPPPRMVSLGITAGAPFCEQAQLVYNMSEDRMGKPFS
jgi:hypothetical protein